MWGDWVTTGKTTNVVTAIYFHKVLETKPSGGAWSAQSQVNGMEMEWGNSDDVIGIPFIDNVSLEVEWTEVSAPTVTRLPPQMVVSQAVSRSTW